MKLAFDSNWTRLGAFFGVASIIGAFVFFLRPDESDSKILLTASNIATPKPVVAGNVIQAPENRVAVKPSNGSAKSSDKVNWAGQPYWKVAQEVGYGIYISRALVSNDPQLAFSAVKIINDCADIDERVDEIYKKIQALSSNNKIHSIGVKEFQHQQAIQRQCQSITPEMVSAIDGLLQKAARGGALGASAAYIGQRAGATLSEGEKGWLLLALIQDAQHGDIPAIRRLGCDWRNEWLPVDQRDTYRAALEWAAKNSPEAGQATMWLSLCIPNNPATHTNASVPDSLREAILENARRRRSGEI